MENQANCLLTPLPDDRYRHTQDGNIICGGGSSGRFRKRTRNSCITLNENGEWKVSHRLIEPRYSHVSWRVRDGILLMGGENSPDTTEMVKNDGTVELSFMLEYNAR